MRENITFKFLSGGKSSPHWTVLLWSVVAFKMLCKCSQIKGKSVNINHRGERSKTIKSCTSPAQRLATRNVCKIQIYCSALSYSSWYFFKEHPLTASITPMISNKLRTTSMCIYVWPCFTADWSNANTSSYITHLGGSHERKPPIELLLRVSISLSWVIKGPPNREGQTIALTENE